MVNAGINHLPFPLLTSPFFVPVVPLVPNNSWSSCANLYRFSALCSCFISIFSPFNMVLSIPLSYFFSFTIFKLIFVLSKPAPIAIAWIILPSIALLYSRSNASCLINSAAASSLSSNLKLALWRPNISSPFSWARTSPMSTSSSLVACRADADSCCALSKLRAETPYSSAVSALSWILIYLLNLRFLQSL